MKVLFRLDAGQRSGLGHLMRCLTLAKSFKDSGIESFLLIKSDDQSIIESLLIKSNIGEDNYKILLFDLNIEDDIAMIKDYYSKGFLFLILDHYNVDIDYQKSLKDSNIKWGQFDYSIKNRILADLVINANLSVNEKDYKDLVNKDTKLCVGYKYAIIGDKFIGHEPNKENNRILIAMGGGQYPPEIFELIRFITNFKEYVFDVVSGYENLFDSDGKTPSNVNFHYFPDNIPSIYSKCMSAVVAGGITTFELAKLNIPFFIVPFTSNQVLNAKAWDQYNFGLYFNDSKEFIESINHYGLNHMIGLLNKKFEDKKIMIDGKGASRIVEAIKKIITQDNVKIHGERIYIREMTEEDAPYIINWRNNPEIKKWMFQQQDLTLESHINWFRSNKRSNRVDYVICDNSNDEPIGTVNFINIENNIAEAGKMLGDMRYWGKGYAKEAFLLWLNYGFKQLGLKTIMIKTMSNNMTNIKLNEKIGFKFKEEIVMENKDYNIIIMTINKETMQCHQT